MNKEIENFNSAQSAEDRAICSLLMQEIDEHLILSESKIWHRHPVWFLEGNPIVGYSKLKDSLRLMFCSGQSFNEEGLQADGNFKAASIRYSNAEEVHIPDLRRWLAKAQEIQWDYKNIAKRKGTLLRLK